MHSAPDVSRPAFSGFGAPWLAATLTFSALCVSFTSAADEAPRADGALRVSIDFLGGSGKVQSLDAAKQFVSLTPTPHPDRGWVCWWYARIDGLDPQRPLTLTVGPAPWATPDRATISVDGREWRHGPAGRREGKEITYEIPLTGPTLYVAWGPPFTPDDAQRLVDEGAKSPHATAYVLAKSRGGRPVPALRVEQEGVPAGERRGIWVNARQHAWESGSSWVCRGFVEWLVSDDPRAEALRKQAVVHVTPVMDIDNVAIGAGGKEEKPQDHNRDWSDAPHHPAVAAAQRQILAMNKEGGFDFFLDLHNPGANDRQPFYFITPRRELSEIGERNLDRWLIISRAEMTGPLAFRGATRESGPGYSKEWTKISKNWVTFNTQPHVVSLTLETSWNTPESTTENYRRLGAEVGIALERYFRENGRE